MIYEKLPVVLLSTLASEKKDTTNALIAGYVLAHQEEVAAMGIKELAAACHVGLGSVSRFVREIGLRDFSELKQILRTSLSSFVIPDTDAYALEYAARVSDAVKKAAASLDLRKTEQLCDDLHSYGKICTYGMLKGISAAVDLQTDMLMMGKLVHTSVAYGDQMEEIIAAGKETLIIIFSYTGSYFEYRDFREKEKHLALPKIWMVCGTKKPVPWFVDEVLTFASDLDLDSHPYQLETAAHLIVETYARKYRKGSF